MFVVVVVAALLALPGSLRQGAADARARFLEGDFAGAVAAADRVEDDFELGPAYAEDDGAFAIWADAQVTKALALRRLGKEPESDACLRAILAVRPTWRADKSFVPPKTMARLDELRDEALQAPPQKLTAVVRAGGTLLLDGRKVAAGVLEVVPGAHYLALAGDVPGKKIDVRRPQTVTFGEAPKSVGSGVDEPPPRRLDDNVPPPPASADEGSPWVWVGVGVGALAVVGVGVGVGVALALAPENPGGTTVKVDASRLGAAQ